MDVRIVYFLLLSCASVFAQYGEIPCEGEQLLDTKGNCVDPIISRNIYVFAEPEKEVEEETYAPYLPAPKLEYNIVFVRAPELGEGSDPIIVPPPQQKTIVYVLSKKGENNEPKIIEIPAAPKQKPEVYYVSYAEGENPKLPGGVDLQTALDTAAQPAGEVGADGASQGVPAAGKPAPAPGTHTAPAAPPPHAVYTPPATAPPAVYTPPATAPPAVYTPPSTAPPAVYTPPATVAPAVYTPSATAPPAVYTPPATAPPAVYTPPAPAPQQPNYVYVQPQPQKRYVQPQNVYLSPQQVGLGHFQPLGFPTQQG